MVQFKLPAGLLRTAYAATGERDPVVTAESGQDAKTWLYSLSAETHQRPPRGSLACLAAERSEPCVCVCGGGGLTRGKLDSLSYSCSRWTSGAWKERSIKGSCTGAAMIL
jgi:hypothetical protein